ncbi:hypothetical protein BV25DRAFT_1921905 [Artomyces pyxidatus]|uniref:Uncharacterized protein n=1 Tax=Artomyces pyxidatus TaxID=48021 RepID=A0ACB8SGH3_9AGAM|nr:hypothetical protein BV25DRAFT_1921905 [Artomyces pyxidatus]
MIAAFLLLPDDALLYVFGLLQYADLLALQITCSRIYTLILNSAVLQYNIELAACGMIDGGTTIDTQERLQRLRTYTLAWRTLGWADHNALTFVTEYLSRYSNSGSVIGYHGTDSTHRRREIKMTQLPSKLRGVRERRADLDAFMYARDVLVDASQDLVVYTPPGIPPLLNAGGYYFRSLSTGEPHGLACSPGSVEPGEPQVPRLRIALDICGDYILENVERESRVRQLSVWNWKTGAVEVYIPRGDMEINSGRFLDAHHLLFERARDPTSPRDRQGPAYLQVIAWRTPGAPLHTFLFPEFMQDRAHVSFELSPAQHSSRGDGCFFPDPTNRLISARAIVATATAPRVRYRKFHVDIPTRTLLSYVADHPSEDSVIVPWDAWGPRGTRATPAQPSDRPLRPFMVAVAVDGMRRVSLHTAPDSQETTLTILDYHPRRVARAAGGRAVVEGGVIEAGLTGDGFGEVRTRLPCIVSELPLPAALAGLAVSPGGVGLCTDGLLFFERDTGDHLENVWAYTF